MKIQKVTVVGGGTMGRQIALNAAISGFDTAVNDSFPGVLEAVAAWSEKYLDTRVEKGKLTAGAVEAVKARFHMEADLAKAVAGADLVIEAVIENLDLKLDIFGQLDRLCRPEAILASNSSTFFPSQYRVATKRPDKVIGMHYFNPALQMQLLEVVMSGTVSEETLALVMEYGEITGKKVIISRKERPGFIVNNIFGAITTMAWELLEGGYASFEDIDTAAEKGLGHPMGPFRTMDYSGLDTILSVRKSRYESDPAKFPAPNEILMSKVAKGELGVKTGKGFYEYHK